LEENMGTSNGIEVSPDQKLLYVNESKQLNIWVYVLGLKKQKKNEEKFEIL